MQLPVLALVKGIHPENKRPLNMKLLLSFVFSCMDSHER